MSTDLCLGLIKVGKYICWLTSFNNFETFSTFYEKWFWIEGVDFSYLHK